jgi:metal-responsive CopG/Arc/MetJ family transcriptional regulator
MDMKTAISIPDAVFEEAEEAAKRLGISRSRLYTKAIERYLAALRCCEVTERLDEIYGEQPARIDPLLQSLQLASLESEDW